jgi:hypothetical protein
MRRSVNNSQTEQTWVIYQSTVRRHPHGLVSVCDQSEWEAMERLQPGTHPLIQAGIKTEGEAERLARQPRPTPPNPAE